MRTVYAVINAIICDNLDSSSFREIRSIHYTQFAQEITNVVANVERRVPTLNPRAARTITNHPRITRLLIYKIICKEIR